MDKMNVKIVKNFIIVFIIGFVIASGLSYWLFSNQLQNERITKDRIIAINQQFKIELATATSTIKSLTRQQKVDRDTIDKLKASQQRLTNANRELRRLLEQQGSAIDTIDGISKSDEKILERLQQIIEGLPKRK
jgi:uncharacterized protein HemX